MQSVFIDSSGRSSVGKTFEHCMNEYDDNSFICTFKMIVRRFPWKFEGIFTDKALAIF